MAMIDDEAPTPRPFQVDPRLLRRQAEPDRPGAGRAWHTDASTGPSHDPSRPWQPVAGPADRTTFFAEQARHRRATWRLSVMATLSIVLAGLPLSLVVTPIVYLAIIVLTKLASFVVPISPAVPRLFRSVAWSIGMLMAAVEASDKGPVPASILGPALVGVLMLVLPGILTMVVLWLLLRRLFSGPGVGGLAIGLGAREPRPADLEEHQLVNIVEEMAIAAGLPAPRVMLLDGEVANAAVVGSSPSDAVVVVSRRLLDDMDRDETQGVLAQLIASIGNGDLGVALSMVTVFRTFGLVNTLLDAPVSRSARGVLWRLLGVLRDRSGRDAATRAAQAARLLGSRVSMMELEDVDLVLGSDEEKRRAPSGILGLLLKIRIYALFPIWAAAGMAKTALMVMIMGLVGPLLALTWRTRRFLADATAVQLTRNPDGVARGLEGLLSRGGGIRGGAWADHLFVVGGGVRDGSRGRPAEMPPEVAEMLSEIDRENAGKSGADLLAARMKAGARYRLRLAAAAAQREAESRARYQEAADGSVAPGPESPSDTGVADEEMGGLSWVSFHPSLAKRLKRLRAMGAHVRADEGGRPMNPAQIGLLLAFGVPLALLMAVLLGIVVVLSTGLTIIFMMIPMAVVYWVFEWLF
jgi:Zn-dependent protease with chaperone function